MITVNKERCTGCLTCVKVCPFTVLGEKDGKPQLREGKGIRTFSAGSGATYCNETFLPSF